MKRKIENIRLISIVREDPEEFSRELAKVNSNKLIGEPKFNDRFNQRTGRTEFYYKAVSRI